MKKIKLIFTFLMVAAFMVSCDTDGGSSELDLKVGAVPNFEYSADFPTILNLNELAAGTVIDIGVSVDIAQGDVASADIVGFYQTAAGDVYGPVTLTSNVTEFPAELVYSTDDLISAFSELNSNADFKLGDELLITTKLYLADGTELDLRDADGRLYGSDVHTSTVYDVVANYPVGCPLNGKFTGEYQMTVDGGGGFGVFAESQVVTLAEDSQTLRSFDFTYLPQIGGFAQTFSLEFICETVLVPKVDTGLSCGGPSLTFGSTDGGVVIDPQDDSGFTIVITDWIDGDGGCGAGSSYDVTITFEKI